MDINFEFGKTRKFRDAFIPALLCVAMIGAGGAAWRYARIHERHEALRASLAEVQGELARRAAAYAAQSAPSAEEASDQESARSITASLKVPWSALFNEIGDLCGKNVALLSVEPEAQGKIVKISAEAKDAQAMLGFVQRAADSTILKDAHLTTHHVSTADPMRPVRFEVQARWQFEE